MVEALEGMHVKAAVQLSVHVPSLLYFEQQLLQQNVVFSFQPFTKVERGHTILVRAAAGGTGSLLCQCAKALGGIVIGTVSTKEKAAQAKEDGWHHVIVTKEEYFAECVTKITSEKGVDVVYDSVGKDTFEVEDIELADVAAVSVGNNQEVGSMIADI